MEYPGLATADLSNVRSLNAGFLSVIRASADGARLRSRLPGPIREYVAAITDLQLERLASCPVLLMSFRESDMSFWRNVTAGDAGGDLLQIPPPAAMERLMTAGLAFLWQLARRNAYSVRVVSGGRTDFCDCLTSQPLVCLLDRTAGRGDLAVPRFADDSAIWSRLLGPGISSSSRVRTAAHLSVLQAMLTRAEPARQRLRAAACASSVPALRIWDKSTGH